MTYRNLLLSVFFVLPIALFISHPAYAAQEVQRYTYELIPFTEIAEKIEVKSAINSDALLIGSNVVVNAEINGDLFVIAENLEINAPIRGNLRVISTKTVLSSIVQKSFSFISEKIEIKPMGEVENDAYGFVSELTHNGRIGKNLNISFNPETRAEINGKVIQNVYYTSGILSGSKSLIQGSIIEIKQTITKNDTRKSSLLSNLFQSISLIMVYLLIRYTRPNIFHKLISKTNSENIKLIGKGLLGFVLIPVIATLFAISIVGFPISMFLLSILLVSIYITPIFGALLISKQIFKDNAEKILPISISILLINLIYIAPFFGIIVIVLSNLITLGILIEYILEKKHE